MQYQEIFKKIIQHFVNLNIRLYDMILKNTQFDIIATILTYNYMFHYIYSINLHFQMSNQKKGHALTEGYNEECWSISTIDKPYCSPTREREREMFYLTTHSTHFIYGYMASDIWLRTILIVRKETCCRHIGYSYRLTARVLLYAPSHRQDNTYHSLCYTSRGALAGTRNNFSPTITQQ